MKQAPAQTFQDLIAWQKAHEYVLCVYRHTESFPQVELYGLTSQFRRAAVSVPANIAEGFKKTGRSDKLRYLNIAQGSLEECRYYMILSRDLGYSDCADAWPIHDETSRLIQSYAGAIRQNVLGRAAPVQALVGSFVSGFYFLHSVS